MTASVLFTLLAQAGNTVRVPSVDWAAVMPELILAGAALIGLLYEALSKRSEQMTHLAIGLIGIAGSATAALLLWDWNFEAKGHSAMGGMVTVDRFGVVSRLLLLAIAVFGLLLGTDYMNRQSEDQRRGELAPLMLLATTGMMMFATSNDLILMFISLEVLSLSLYVLTGVSGARRSTEASMKYFLLGAFSSAFFLYGVAMAFGAANSTNVGALARTLSGETGSLALGLVALALLAVGFAFKTSMAPFHMWTPDVYQGAPTPVTAFMSAGTKVAAFLALIRVLDVAFQPLTTSWIPVLWVLAAVSIVLGSVLAIAQSDVKRMLAYSSVAHAGFIVTGLTAASGVGIRAAMFYLVAYAATTLGAFGIVMLVTSRDEEDSTLESFSGLFFEKPLLASLMTVFLLSLAGIPPTAGFIAKVNVFGAAASAGHWQLVLIGVIASVAAAFFYLRVIVYMFMRDPRGVLSSDETGMPGFLPNLAIVLTALIVVALGIFPGIITGIIQKASELTW